MVEWRSLGFGSAVFLVLLLTTLAYESDPLILILGLPTGFIAGYFAGGILKGGLYGFVLGLAMGLFFFFAFYYLATQGPAYPGIGFGLFIAFLFGIFLAIQGIVAGILGGLFRSLIGR